MALPANKTLLVITAIDDSALILPQWSARGIKEEPQEIDMPGQDPVTSCGGVEIDGSHEQFRKLQVTITCTDLRAPLMPKLWKGKTVEIQCTHERGFATATGQQDRPAVPNAYGTGIETRIEGDNTWFRPLLRCMIMSVRHGFDEYGAAVNWQIVAREIQVPTV